MVTRKDTLFERFLAPLAQLVINQDELRQLSRSIDWEKECDRVQNPTVTYPSYYSEQNFHGIEGGYLTHSAAVTYDPITQYALPPNETWVRQSLLDAIRVKPRRILDLGCGTGSTTLMLKKVFPQAEIVGLDLSPHMLVMAEYKAKKADLAIHWRHGKAEDTQFEAASFDLITASLLCHELPPKISEAMLKESFRLLKPGGEMIVLDGTQKLLRQTEWLNQIFEEPYIQSYAEEDIEAWFGRAGFRQIQSEEFWWLHQVTRGIKPLPVDDAELFIETDMDVQWAMG
jgi:ubiquinone/menaquinone biosynthesis C-methylase UbiE